MAIISQVKEGEYLITTYDSGHVIKEIDQTEKIMPDLSKEQVAEKELEDLIQAKIRELAIEALKAEGKLSKDGELVEA